MASEIKLLDCTLRDGGFCLEDAAKNGILDKHFETNEINDIIQKLTSSGIDIIELGSIEISENDKKRYAIYQSIEEISKKKIEKEDKMYAALYRGPDTPIEDIPDYNESLCEMVRVIIRYSEMQKSLDFCRALSRKGYKVFIQPMLTMRYTDKELQMIFDAANEMDAYAVYFVDSYGYMMEDDALRMFQKYDLALKEQIYIGFHAHNNMDLAYSNVLAFIKNSGTRKIIVDACAIGFGQGAGNLQTEIIANYLNQKFGKNYNISCILNVCEIVERFLGRSLWGYSTTRFLSASHGTAYKYAVALRDHYKLSLEEIDCILANVPEDLIHRYTEENTEELLKFNGYRIQSGGEKNESS